jgi:hypothetical protein
MSYVLRLHYGEAFARHADDDAIDDLAAFLGAEVRAREVDLDELRKRLEIARACVLPGRDMPVAVSVAGHPLVYGTFRWRRDEPDPVTRFGRPDWREAMSPVDWQVEAEIYEKSMGEAIELRWGDVDSQPYSGLAFAKGSQLELNEPVKTTFQGFGPVTREES